jgi:RNA polymerase sigma factor (sigma-70 family)
MSNERESSNLTSAKVDLPEIDDELAREVLRSARSLALRMTGRLDGAEDLRQVALLKYLQLDEKTRREIMNPRAYLSQVMKNELLNRIRKEKEHLTDSVETLEREPTDAYPPEHIDVAILLREIWDRIDGPDRQLLELMNFGFKGSEIARILNISDDAARQRISRLKNKIKVILCEKQYSG